VPTAPAPAPTPGRAPGRVLIVDDNVELVGTLQAVLSRATGTERGEPSRLEVVTASRGEEALAIARSQGFDVAIVDVKLPDTSGVDLIEPLRAASPLGEVVLITGFASVDAAIGALRSGAFAFVLKSFRAEELISTVDQALAKVRLQREREELESRYRALIQLTDVLAVAIDTDGKVALFNRKAAQTSGIAAAVALGKDFVESFIAPADMARVRESLTQARTGERTSEVEAGFVAGSPRRIRWHLSSERKGLAVGLVYAVGIDVTERRSLEKRAADAEALSTMGTLAMNLAHEVRNPLNAAVLQLHLLERDVGKLHLDETKSKALLKRTEIVGAEIGRLNRLLTEFLDLARPRGIAREPVHLGSLVEEVLALESGTASSSGVTIEKDLDADGCVAIGDHEKLKQVMINLVVNAIEAMKEGGRLSARATCEGSNVVVTLEDTGVGIEQAHMQEVFEPFFTTKEAGTGLGLSIVRKIVDQHGGDVRIESARGKGTRVTVAIPAAPVKSGRVA
jgi:two-component system, cell cycle sensor histidine kinase and response regulator CckA